MKKAVVFFSVAVLLAATGVNAQSGAQLRAGLNLANVSVTEEGEVDEAKMLTSFHVGFVGDASLGGIVYLQPGIIFTGKGSKTQRGTPSSLNYSKATTNLYYVEVPANLVLKFPMSESTKFFAGAGPYLGIGVSGKTKIEGALFSGERNVKFSNDDPSTLNYNEGAGFGIIRRFDYGLNVTTGFEGKPAVFAVSYGLGMAKLQSASNSQADDKNKHRVLSFSVGIKL